MNAYQQNISQLKVIAQALGPLLVLGSGRPMMLTSLSMSRLIWSIRSSHSGYVIWALLKIRMAPCAADSGMLILTQ